MKFEEMTSSNNKKYSSFKKRKSTIISIVIFFSVFILFFVVYYSLMGFNKEEKTSNVDSIELTKSDLLVQTLYSKVHDFSEKNPLWMYKEETGSLVSNMTESTKMTLVYINLKMGDFFDVNCSNVPATINGYEDYACSSVTKAVKLDNVSRVYKELFGENTYVATSSVMKRDFLSSGIYVYVSDIDAYVLYSKGAVDTSETSNVYSYEITKVVSTSSDIKIYEQITNSSSDTNNNVNYVYTFKLDSSGNYVYYSCTTV